MSRDPSINEKEEIENYDHVCTQAFYSMGLQFFY